jgi:hypothetical protein
MTPQELADEIMPQVEEAYKDVVLTMASKLTREARERGNLVYQQSKLGEIRVIIPIPEQIMQGISVGDLADLLAQREFVTSAGKYEEDVIRDEAGDIQVNFFQQDLVAMEVLCKPLRDVRLA